MTNEVTKEFTNKTIVISPSHHEYRSWLSDQEKYNRLNTKPVVRSRDLRGVAIGSNAVVIGFPHDEDFEDVFRSRQLNIKEQ